VGGECGMYVLNVCVLNGCVCCMWVWVRGTWCVSVFFLNFLNYTNLCSGSLLNYTLCS